MLDAFCNATVTCSNVSNMAGYDARLEARQLPSTTLPSVTTPTCLTTSHPLSLHSLTKYMPAKAPVTSIEVSCHYKIL